jgi:glucose/arabinose dehydrogenase
MKRSWLVMLLTASVVALAVAPRAAAQTTSVVMSGLDNPRGLAFGPQGALYVAEAGRAGPGPCVLLRGAPQC